MNLGDLLDELREGILNDRSDRTSGTADYLWTDARLVRYINEAQRRFAVQGLVLRDNSTAEVVEFDLVEGQQDYVLHEAIISVMTAKVSTSSADLQRVGHSLLSMSSATADVGYDPSAYAWLPPGAPLAYSTEEGLSDQLADGWSQVVMRVFPTPDAAAAGTTIKMQVIRKPLEKLEASCLTATPEIPEDHHIEMLDWAAYLALRIVDDDAGSSGRAKEFAAAFQSHVTEARKLAMRKLFAPAPWGFGRHGFAWETGHGG